MHSAYTASPNDEHQDAPLERAFYYRANNAFALIGADGTLTKTGDAFAAVGSMNDTPLRLASTGDDTNGLAVEAGRSWRPGGPIQVLISNYEIPAADQGPFPDPPIVNDTFAIPGIGTFTLLPRRSVSYVDNGGYDLTVNHIRGGRSGVIVSRYRVDDTHNLTLIDRTLERGDTAHVSALLPAPGLELVTISPVRTG